MSVEQQCRRSIDRSIDKTVTDSVQIKYTRQHQCNFLIFLYEIFALREILAYHFISYNQRLHIIVSCFDEQ